jgi:hypothetical protein
MILVFLTLLSIKHFIVDFLLQRPYHYENKGIYGHPGGVQHAIFHGVGTTMCFILWAPFLAVILGVIDALVHYHIDWAKVQLNIHYNLTPDNEKFWWLLGADQLAHYLTYILLVWLVV